MIVERCVAVFVLFLQNRQKKKRISAQINRCWTVLNGSVFFFICLFVYCSPSVCNSDELQLKHAKPVHPLSIAAEVPRPRMEPLNRPHLHPDVGQGQPDTH